MSIFSYTTSNPAFSRKIWKSSQAKIARMTMTGLFLKAIISLILLGISTWYVWSLVEKGVDIKWYTSGGMLAAIIFSILTSYKRIWAPITTPLYALSKGLFLGGISAYAEIRFPGKPMKAVSLTILTFLVILLLYQLRLIKVTKRFKSVLFSVTITILCIYIINWILTFFGLSLPFVWGTSWFAIGFNFLAVVIASFFYYLTLIL